MNLLRSKLSVPRIAHGLVPRPRVNGLFAVGAQTRLCLLSAPPGFGKTSAVVGWLGESGRRAGWLSLDEGDNDPGRFLPYLVAAIGAGEEEPGHLAHLSDADEVDVVAGLAALLEEPDAPEIVVLDDLHVVRSLRVFAILDSLLARLPEDRLLVVVTREDPPLRLSRLRAAGALVELRAEQLRFTLAEADAFFRERMDVALSPDALLALNNSAEGWPAVLQLAALSLVGRPDAGRRAAEIAADHRLILDYITEEVLDGLEQDVVDFLLRTSHLDRLTGELCDAVTGTSGGAEMLVRLERQNLLLVPLDDQRRWYRYHRLFADLLRMRARTVAPEVHWAAANWYHRNDYLSDALDHAVQAGDFGRTEPLIWQLGSRMLHQGEVPAVRSALARLPAADARSSVAVCLLQGWACVLGDPRQDPGQWLDLALAAAARAEPGAERLAPILPGMALMVRAIAASHVGRHLDAVELARAALREGPGEGAEPRLALVFAADGLTALGHAYWEGGDTGRAVDTYREALPLLREAGNWLAVAEMTSNLARIELGRHRPAEALSLCDEYGRPGTPADARVLLARAEALRDLRRPEAADVARAAGEHARAAGDLTTLTQARGLAASRGVGTFALPGGGSVSAREREVLALIAAGRSNAQIAAELYVSVGTVKTHAHSIATKLATNSRTERAEGGVWWHPLPRSFDVRCTAASRVAEGRLLLQGHRRVTVSERCAEAGPGTRPAVIELLRYSSIDDVPVGVWDGLASTAAVGMESGHLRAVEASRINDLHPYYFVGLREGQAVGVASCSVLDLDLTRMVNQDPPEVLAAVKEWQPDFLKLRVLEVGHLASVGATIEAAPGVLPEFLQALAPEIDRLAEQEHVDLGVIRDIPADLYPDFRALEEDGYRPAPGFPIARLALGWEGLDGYVAALKHKRRQQVRALRARFDAPKLSVEVIEDYGPYAERLAELWTQVALRHGEYEHEWLTPAYFTAMARQLRGRSHVVAVKLDGLIVAFGLGLIGDEEYFGVAEGMDHTVRDEFALYPNLFLEVIREACKLGCKRLNLGITTYDFKTSLGAELEPVCYLVKAFARPELSAGYAELFATGIRQPTNRHRAFAGPAPARVQPGEALLALRRDEPRDPFVRQLGYARADMSRAVGLYPFRPVFDSAQEPVVRHEGRDVVMLGTNSYLGLATHPRVRAAAREAIERYGSGCSGSPMLNGTLDLHDELARRLAAFAGKDDALVFSTGYQTNLGVVSAVVGPGDVALMDERCHASLIDGARLARATVVRYRHADVASLADGLARTSPRRTLVITDSLFSMEGTVVDLPAIVRLVRAHHARLLLDESHAVGVLGPNGRGVAEHYGLTSEVDLLMGTLSKSLASIGGFVAGDRKVIDTLRNTARSHLFSASLPPASVAAALCSLDIIETESELRTRLLANARFLAAGLRQLGYRVADHGNAILPVYCGNELLTLAAYKRLLGDGVFVNPVTHPAVPKGEEILRISLMATHTESVLRRALDAFDRARTATWPATDCPGGTSSW